VLLSALLPLAHGAENGEDFAVPSGLAQPPAAFPTAGRTSATRQPDESRPAKGAATPSAAVSNPAAKGKPSNGKPTPGKATNGKPAQTKPANNQSTTAPKAAPPVGQSPPARPLAQDLTLEEAIRIAVADNRGVKKVLAVGKEAKDMLGRTPGNIIAVRPMKEGVIADFEKAEAMLSHFIQKAHNRTAFVRPRIIIGVPSRITQVEQRAVRDSAELAGAREVYLIEEPVAAAIGAGLPITEPSGNMVVDIGGGTTDIAVISLGGIVYSESVKVAGDRMDDAIMNYIKKKYNLLIGEHMAERIKFEIGSAYPFEERKTMMIKGRDLISGIPRTLVVDDAEVREALQEPIGTIVNAIKVALENTPPELAGDIIDRGIVLTGGGSLLKGMDTRFREETNLPIITVDDPLTSVVLGVGKILDELDLLRKVSVMSQCSTSR